MGAGPREYKSGEHALVLKSLIGIIINVVICFSIMHTFPFNKTESYRQLINLLNRGLLVPTDMDKSH